jgi:hypothetical protein
MHGRVSLFTRKKTLSIKQSYHKDMFKKASTAECTSTIVVSHNPLSPTPSTSSALKTPENTEKELDVP